MTNARRSAILGIATGAIATAVNAAWPVLLEDNDERLNQLLVAVAFLLTVFAIGYLRLHRQNKAIDFKTKILEELITEMKAVVADASKQMHRALRVVEVESEKLCGLYRIRELAIQKNMAKLNSRESVEMQSEMRRIVNAFQETTACALDACTQARAAIQAVQTQKNKLDDFERKQSLAAQPRWKVAGEFTHGLQHEFNLRNLGAPASDLNATWEKHDAISVMFSNTTLINTGECVAIKVFFHGQRLPEVRIALIYSDAIDVRRTVGITVSDIGVEVEKVDV